MKKLYCCEASRGMYEDYYTAQSGSGFPIYQGSQGQRGHGLGSMLSGLFRSAFPMIKRGLAQFGKHALKTGLEVANDMVDNGQTFGDSARRRIPDGIKRFVSTANFNTQSGSGRHRRARKRRKATPVNKRKIKKRKTSCNSRRDIFS